MSENIETVLTAINERMRQEYGLESRIGFEWEFQLLTSKGEAVPVEKLQALLGDDPTIARIYKERSHGLLEITTQPLSPVEAAKALQTIQEKVAQWAKEQDYHLSASSMVSGIDRANGSVGLHVNSSLVNTQNPEGHSVLFGLDSMITPMTANVAQAILEVNKETPLWSFHDPKTDITRLKAGDGTPHKYNSGTSKASANGRIGVSVNNNGDGLPYSANEIGGNPFNVPDGDLDYAANPVRMEERFPSARMDPSVAAFRTPVGQYHALANPHYHKNTRKDSINLGDIPMDWDELAATHMPPDSIFSRYIGTLYDADTLRAIDERGQHSTFQDKENIKFPYDPAARKPKPEIQEAVHKTGVEEDANGQPELQLPAVTRVVKNASGNDGVPEEHGNPQPAPESTSITTQTELSTKAETAEPVKEGDNHTGNDAQGAVSPETIPPVSATSPASTTGNSHSSGAASFSSPRKERSTMNNETKLAFAAGSVVGLCAITVGIKKWVDHIKATRAERHTSLTQ